MVQTLANNAGLPKPRVYIMPGQTPNAFATGRNPEHAAVAVTEGLMQLLQRDELEGVIAHELGHIKNRDILISSIAAVMAGAISYLATMAQWSMIFGGGGGNDDEGPGNLVANFVSHHADDIAGLAGNRIDPRPDCGRGRNPATLPLAAQDRPPQKRCS